LVEITILGKTFLVPERNSLLRAFQFISPETIPYGRFCWNQDCQYCRVDCQLSDDDQARPILSCKFLVSEGMNISNLAPELVGCLRVKLGKAAPSSEALSEVPAIPTAPRDEESH
jgi:NADH dehydrogenase/NADH:ubiquinone oxidoreductase subunit G